MEQYLNNLNDSQRDAVINTEGPSLVIAGAGSGKTRVLTYRIVQLLQKGVPPFSILALTFTNKAAKEMKERIAGLIGQDIARNLWMGTFHSLFAKILRFESELLGYPSSFSIYDTSDTKSLLKSIIKELKLDEEVYKPQEVYARISNAKNNLITSSAYSTNEQIRVSDSRLGRPEVWRIYEVYSQRCFKAGAMDFDDLLLKTNILFRNHADVLTKYQQKFKYILVDEYQDTNFSQALIVKKLSSTHQNLCVVGDDSQSIYSFRGAKIENILNFKNDFPEYKIFKLEENYRSTQNIVNAANSIISKNSRQIPKNVYTNNEAGEKINIIPVVTDREEGFYVANSILENKIRNKSGFKEFAVLYRTNAQSRVFEESFRRRNIPYKIYGGLSFYQRKEIKDILAYCRLVVNQNDDEAVKRIINYPKRGIGDTSILKLEEVAAANNTTIWQFLISGNITNIGINSGTAAKIGGFINLVKNFISKKDESDAYTLVSEIASETGILKELYSDKTAEGVSRYENVVELLSGIKEFTSQQDVEKSELTLEKFLEDVSLLTNEDLEKDADRDKVILMTVHSAKGLEFNCVYIVGLEEDLFPSKFSADSFDELEEERRLFYVAVTRAKKKLTITYTSQRYRWGNLHQCGPSRFINDIDKSYINIQTENFLTKRQQDSEDELFTMESTDISIELQKKPVSSFKINNQRNVQSPNIAPKKTKKSKSEEKINEPYLLNKKLVKLNSTKVNLPTSEKMGGDDTKGLKVGMVVDHERFGKGKVVVLEGDYPNVKATIEFDISGMKQILLKFAKLKIIG